MVKVKKQVKNFKKKLTKEEIEELVLQDQAVEIIKKAGSEAVAVDISSLPHYADASGGVGATGVSLLGSEGAAAGLSASQIALGVLAIGAVAGVAGSGGGETAPDTTAPEATMIVYPEVELDGISGGYDSSPQITSLGTNGEFVVTWEGYNGSNYDIFVQKFDANGTPVGSEVQLDGVGSDDRYPQITSVGTNGEFVVTWYGYGGSSYDIFVQKFDSDGTPVGSEVQLDVMGGSDANPRITSVGTNGEFVVAWNGNNGSNYDIFVQKFDSDGIPVGSKAQLDGMGGYEDSHQITSVGTNGEFVVTWRGSNGSNSDIFVQKFAANGTPVGSKVQLDGMGSGDGYPQITSVGTNGEFVVTWQGDDNYTRDIFVQKFDSDGTPVGSEAQLDFGIDDRYPQIASLGTSGEFVVTWEGYNGSNYDIFVQKFNSDGTPVGIEVQLDGTGSDDSNPQITSVGTNGEFVVTWYSHNGSNYDIFVQKFNSDGTPVGSEVQLDGMGGYDGFPQIISVGTNGEFVIAWNGSNGSNYDIFVQKFDSNGAVISNILAESNEVGTGYLVNSGISVSDVLDITNSADNMWNSVDIILENTTTAMSTAGLAAGTYYLYTIDVAGNLSDPSALSYTII